MGDPNPVAQTIELLHIDQVRRDAQGTRCLFQQAIESEAPEAAGHQEVHVTVLRGLPLGAGAKQRRGTFAAQKVCRFCLWQILLPRSVCILYRELGIGDIKQAQVFPLEPVFFGGDTRI